VRTTAPTLAHPDPTSPDDLTDAKAVCVRSMHAMATGDLAELEATVHHDATNREAKDEPPATRGTGPAAFLATSDWLRATFSDLAFEIHDVVHDGELVVVHDTMTGCQTGPSLFYGEDGRVREAMPATGRTFASTQTHWFRMKDGLVIEHWANRDDLKTAVDLGWVPPSPVFLVRMALAKRRARRAEDGRG
jgi:ketosteroid isomerase-like protein